MAFWPFRTNDKMPPPAEDTAVIYAKMKEERDRLHKQAIDELDRVESELLILDDLVGQVLGNK